MPIQYLLLHAGVGVPDAARLIATSSDDLVALWIELDLRYLILVALEQCSAGASEHIIDASQAVCRGRRQLVARVVERGIQHLVVMAFECFYALS